MQRSTLTNFLLLLVAISGFSAVTGAASLVWKPGASTRGGVQERHDPNASADEDDEEDSLVVADYRNSDTKEFSNGTLRGQVTDPRTGDPLAEVEANVVWYVPKEAKPNEGRGAIYQPEGLRTKTDANGRYEIAIPASLGEVRLRFEKAGYLAKAKFVGFRSQGTLDITLEREAWLVGKVVDSSGASVTGFHVTARASGLFGIPTNSRSHSYLSGTRFNLPLAKGAWEVTVRAKDGSGESKPTKVTVGREDVELTFVLERPEDGAAPASRR